MRLRVGLVGLGDQWMTRHRPALIELADRFEVKAICCEIAERSKQMADDFGAVAMDGFRAMIQRNDIDAIMALATDWVGPLPILAACDSGKAVYSAAALDIAPGQAVMIRDRVRESGIAFMAELPRRHAPATLRLKELMATRLGPPRILFCHARMPVEHQANRLRRGEYCPLTWRSLMELVDWCRYLVGTEPNSVISNIHQSVAHKPDRNPVQGNEESVARTRNDSVNDIFYQTVSLQFPESAADSGRPLAQMSVGHYIPERWQDALSFRRPASIQVCCERGTAFIDLPSSLTWFDDAGQHTESLESDRPVGVQMLDQFHRSVTSIIQQTCNLEDAYRAMKVAMAANESAKTGNCVSLSFEDGQ